MLLFSSSLLRHKTEHKSFEILRRKQRLYRMLCQVSGYVECLKGVYMMVHLFVVVGDSCNRTELSEGCLGSVLSGVRVLNG